MLKVITADDPKKLEAQIAEWEAENPNVIVRERNTQVVPTISQLNVMSLMAFVFIWYDTVDPIGGAVFQGA